MPDADMTLQEAANLLGVHYMTAYRYIRLGLLPAEKRGGTWRVRRDDAEDVLTGASPTASSTVNGRRRAPWSDRLEARLLAGDGRGAWGVVEAALSAGTEPDELYLDVISPALTSIGSRWERGEIDITDEHRASGIAMRLIGRLGPRFVRRGRTRGTVILGTPAGERHSLPVSLLADIVRGAGFEVSDFGSDVPAEAFARAVAMESDRLVAVGVSVTAPECLDAAAELLATLRSVVDEGVPLLVGGWAVRDEAHARALGADGFAADGRGMVALLDRAVIDRRDPGASEVAST